MSCSIMNTEAGLEQRPHAPPEDEGLGAVEAGGRLVEQEQAGLPDQRAGDPDQLPLPVGEVDRRRAARVLELDQVQGLVDAVPRRPPAAAG